MPGGNALILSLLGISLYLLSRQTSSRHRVGDMAAHGCAMTAITISLPVLGILCARPNVRWKCNGACRYGRIGYARGAKWPQVSPTNSPTLSWAAGGGWRNAR
ncbi:MAG: hypothetical protein QF879_07040 [Candidatus Latescibacteria bacterium]|nr:hypothetical protein [Candidatus Latescibacterota bacterium]